MRVIFSGLARARRVDSIDALTVLRNTLLSETEPTLIQAARHYGEPRSDDLNARHRSNLVQALAFTRFYQAFRAFLQDFLTGDSGSGMPLLIYRQSEVIA
ncbi:hypothetical protein [Atlantibacter sp.]|uniref:hypothetical protein n=1 Tax=Atlantibacter sp. TaxID=1903473 RepID=UPI0028ADF09A|nr:hypothetical protein [Atlantibacter sp.]